MRVVVFAAAVVAALIACNGSGDLAYGGGPADALNITVGDDYFKADTDTIPVTDTVTWTVDSASKDAPHNVTWDSGPPPLPPNSGDLQAGQKYATGFQNTGYYRYHCTHHPGMTGVVLVLPVAGGGRKAL